MNESTNFWMQLYLDAAQPAVKQVGKALEIVTEYGGSLLLPLRLKSEKNRRLFEKNLRMYASEMQNVAEESVVTVAPEIGIPILDKFTYVSNDDLALLYARLLAAGSNSQKTNAAHPSFLNVINNLSPDEARLLAVFLDKPVVPFLEVRRVLESEKNSKFRLIEKWWPIEDLVTKLPEATTLAFPGNIPVYLQNFSGLGLLEIDRHTKVGNEELYSDLEEYYRTTYTVPLLGGDEYCLDFQGGQVRLTPYGDMFIEACVRG